MAVSGFLPPYLGRSLFGGGSPLSPTPSLCNTDRNSFPAAGVSLTNCSKVPRTLLHHHLVPQRHPLQCLGEPLRKDRRAVIKGSNFQCQVYAHYYENNIDQDRPAAITDDPQKSVASLWASRAVWVYQNSRLLLTGVFAIL